MPDAFIWYHADQHLEPDLQQWMETVEEHAGVKGNLYVRIEADKTTFMERYADVSRATIDRIESLAAARPLFKQINRRCESFIQISP